MNRWTEVSRAMVFAKGLSVLLAGLIMLTTTPMSAIAQTPQAVSDDDVNRIASQLYCPVCQNVILDVCPTTACDRWRAAIRSKLEAGWSDQAIEDYFVQQFGARVIGTPPKTGLNWLLYAVAPVGALGMGLTAFLVLRKKKGNQPLTQAAATGSKPENALWREKLASNVREDEDS